MTNEELKALLARATPGPWEWTESLTRLMGPGGSDVVALDWIGQEDAELVVGAADAALIAMAPTLAAEVLALRARVAELEARPLPELPEEWYEEICGDFSGPSGQWVRGRGDWVRFTGELCAVNLPRAVLLRALGVPDVR